MRHEYPLPLRFPSCSHCVYILLLLLVYLGFAILSVPLAVSWRAGLHRLLCPPCPAPLTVLGLARPLSQQAGQGHTRSCTCVVVTERDLPQCRQ